MIFIIALLCFGILSFEDTRLAFSYSVSTHTLLFNRNDPLYLRLVIIASIFFALIIILSFALHKNRTPNLGDWLRSSLAILSPLVVLYYTYTPSIGEKQLHQVQQLITREIGTEINGYSIISKKFRESTNREIWKDTHSNKLTDEENSHIGMLNFINSIAEGMRIVVLNSQANRFFYILDRFSKLILRHRNLMGGDEYPLEVIFSSKELIEESQELHSQLYNLLTKLDTLLVTPKIVEDFLDGYQGMLDRYENNLKNEKDKIITRIYVGFEIKKMSKAETMDSELNERIRHFNFVSIFDFDKLGSIPLIPFDFFPLTRIMQRDLVSILPMSAVKINKHVNYSKLYIYMDKNLNYNIEHIFIIEDFIFE